jgi:IclR family transcriptional regulator, KDG regulon repressor
MPRVKGSSGSGDGILAVDLTFRIVEALAGSPPGLGVTELARLLNATKARIYRHLVTLSRSGFVAQNPVTEKYCVGPRMVSLASSIANGVDLIACARPVLIGLRDEFGHTAILTKLERDQIRVLEVALGTSDFAIMQRVGNTLPAAMLHCTALGKIALAFGPEHLAQDVLARPLKKMTADTIGNARALQQELGRVRKQGWAIVPNEGIVGFNAVAVPVLDADASLAAMVGVIGATRDLPANPSTDLIKSLKRAGETISGALGYATERGPPSIKYSRRA